MRRYLILTCFFVFSVSATVLIVSVLQLMRMRQEDRFGVRRRRRRSLLSMVRARFVDDGDSLRRRSHAAF